MYHEIHGFCSCCQVVLIPSKIVGKKGKSKYCRLSVKKVVVYTTVRPYVSMMCVHNNYI